MKTVWGINRALYCYIWRPGNSSLGEVCCRYFTLHPKIYNCGPWSMVKRVVTLISEFARTAGLSVDTVRFYVRKGIAQP